MSQFQVLITHQDSFNIIENVVFCKYQIKNSILDYTSNLYKANADPFLKELLLSYGIFNNNQIQQLQSEDLSYIVHKNFIQFPQESTIVIFINESDILQSNLFQYKTSLIGYCHYIENSKQKGLFIVKEDAILSIMSFLGISGIHDQKQVILKYLQIDCNHLKDLGYTELCQKIQQRIDEIIHE
ncbi:hypothetical protein SS50377_22671 [Spironucleus salmonicida]|uniref:Uncharacterized protein n=1 Tax=Spironucleus salmonicida TaxID=348837 RepID=V6LZ27_9EUKA|nr:hypothetical protein SS50377_22671 [Spironucleus salmonicida]|eukprot:EST48991.1 Hypothetical protein SS50377_10761 [Spironucleus salmonicida]